MVSTDNEFSFLIVSDIHDTIGNVRKLVDWYQKEKPRVDYILCCGDVVTVPNGEQDLQESAKKYEPIMVNIFQELEKICPRIIYIPGNHEPYTIYKKDAPFLTKSSVNIHRKFVKLTSDLYIVGLGGSTPILQGAKYEVGQIPYKDLDFSKEMYSGYPYNCDTSKENYVKSDQMLLKDLQENIDTMKKQAGDPYYILLTHCGPLYCLTNYMVVQGDNLYLGSEQLGKVFWEESKCFMNIHGHTHTGKGSINLTDTKTVMNPGDLASGNYAYITIKKNSKGVWHLDSSSMNLI